MCGCALIEYNNRSARLKGIALQSDKALVRFALSRWAVIAFNIRNTDGRYTCISVNDWVDSIMLAVNPSPYRDRVIAALLRCRPAIH